MFTHQGKRRTLRHNEQIASLLSFVAGIVNVAGFLSVRRLTTNVTGHFAFFVDEVFKLHMTESLIFFLYIFFFFLGSFVSSLLVEINLTKGKRFTFVIPAIIESLILLVAGSFGHRVKASNPDLIAFSLLFAMGLQNSLVTRISHTMIRTTHLTGLFTDLGIELSQLFVYKAKEQARKLISTIKLRLRIIIFFFLGGIVGGVIYSYTGIAVLILPAVMLIIASLYDIMKLSLIRWRRNTGKA